jgi:hypothetical protein
MAEAELASLYRQRAIKSQGHKQSSATPRRG